MTDEDQFSLVLCMAAEVMVAKRVFTGSACAQDSSRGEETVSINEVIVLPFLLSSAEPGPCPRGKMKP